MEPGDRELLAFGPRLVYPPQWRLPRGVKQGNVTDPNERIIDGFSPAQSLFRAESEGLDRRWGWSQPNEKKTHSRCVFIAFQSAVSQELQIDGSIELSTSDHWEREYQVATIN